MKSVEEMSREELEEAVLGLRKLNSDLSGRIQRVHNYASGLMGADKGYTLTPDERLRAVGRRLKQIAFGNK